MKTAPSLTIKKLGRQQYAKVWQQMQHYTDHRNQQSEDQLWLVEHPPVFTQGQAGKAEHILAPGNIPVIQVDRGGQITYHGPGQIVAYPLIDLRRHGIGVKSLINGIEQAIINTIAEYNITASRKTDAPGVYVNDAKIASLGLRIRKGCSFHGLAFNVKMDLEPFSRINPCGFSGLAMTQLSDLNKKANIETVQQQLIEQLCQQLNFTEKHQ